MNYAIATKYIGPTNTRGARIKATLPSGKSITLQWNHNLDVDENTRQAAKACVRKHILDGADYLSEKAPFVKETFSVYGHKAGYVCIVRLVDKAQEV